MLRLGLLEILANPPSARQALESYRRLWLLGSRRIGWLSLSKGLKGNYSRGTGLVTVEVTGQSSENVLQSVDGAERKFSRGTDSL